ncbi:uncharacterized protein LOC123524297 [Mercenaria mercenaria]|uniref:uncharacterized protein LOC123524297 n=1 Tax=Mercenaria mercenaria TaxID=6596 RepID=UPI001E1D3D75|nr:uncharacterized protein LOC123524297 [Mercenaria mercenaria]
MTKPTILSAVMLVFLVTNGYCRNDNDNVLRFENNPHFTFQGCMLRCLDKDLCCSCKESGKLSMNAAMVNDFSKTCSASDDDVKCSTRWVDSWMNVERSGASNCTVQGNVEKELNKCVRKCKGNPLSKPLDPYHPLHYPGHLSEPSDLSSYTEPDFTEFCNDIRAGGILCTIYGKDSYTAGNTLCRTGHSCGYHGHKYSWCYVDFSGHWDYCCTGPCGFEKGTSYMWCKAGSEWQYCGNAGTTDIQGRKCLTGFPCGVHQEEGKADYFWCYVDMKKNWDRCCEPWDPCTPKGEIYGWCYTGYKKKTIWKKCRKVEE